jgi:hypothetical protein
MKTTRIIFAAAAMMAFATTSAFAGGACCAGKKASSAQQASASCGAKSAVQTADAAGGAGGCHGSMGAMAAATGMNCPVGAGACDWATCQQMNIQYRVTAANEEFKTFDREKAFAFATAEKAPVKYYFLDAAYADETAAKQALFTSMNRLVNDMLTMHCVVNGEVIACEMTAAEKAKDSKSATAWRVASRDFTSKTAAEAYLKKLQTAVASVSVVDRDGKAVKGCATDYAKECGKKNMSFKVADQVASDPVSADVLRAREQLRVVMTTQA